jgi:hypothetical protein
MAGCGTLTTGTRRAKLVADSGKGESAMSFVRSRAIGDFATYAGFVLSKLDGKAA